MNLLLKLAATVSFVLAIVPTIISWNALTSLEYITTWYSPLGAFGWSNFGSVFFHLLTLVLVLWLFKKSPKLHPVERVVGWLFLIVSGYFTLGFLVINMIAYSV